MKPTKRTREQAKGTRKPGEWNRNSILLACAGCIVVGVLLFFGIRLLGQQSQNSPSSTNPGGQSGVVIQQPGSGGGTPPANKGSGGGYSATFLATVKQHIAQGLRLTADRVSTEVQSGKQITDVAAEQGISNDQLHTIEINAYQAAFDQAVQDGTYTQDQANTYMASYRQRDPTQLNATVTTLFGGTPTGE
jgi:hypothetical protein